MRLLTPFPLEHAHALPVTGEHHPLRREYQRWMSMGNAFTMLAALIALIGFLCLKKEPIAPQRHEVVISVGPWPDLPPPPTINVVKNKPSPAAPPKLGVPEPVEDWSAQISQFPTAAQMTAAFDDMGKTDLSDRGGFNVPRESSLPTPDQFVAVEVLPELLRMEAPVYPRLAREAGVEGTVLLRVLVSKEGKVLNVIVLSGNPMLADAARTAAFTARFSPAQQQHKPVPVWVQLPVVFSLN